MSGGLAAPVIARDAMQFAVDERHQAVERPLIPFDPRRQQESYVSGRRTLIGI
jgi:hypothetical protein